MLVWRKRKHTGGFWLKTVTVRKPPKLKTGISLGRGAGGIMWLFTTAADRQMNTALRPQRGNGPLTHCYFYPPASWRYGGSRQNKIKVLSLFNLAAVSLGDGEEPGESFSCPRDTAIDFWVPSQPLTSARWTPSPRPRGAEGQHGRSLGKSGHN